MNQTKEEIQLQYEGYLSTPLLWTDSLFEMYQLKLSCSKMSEFSSSFNLETRLGKRVERFVSHQLKQINEVEILAENIQIIDSKITLGELDCIIKNNKEPIHIEIIYKFYLYDEGSGNNEVDKWIGPNRRDSLVQKLTKLKEKQLPLLYSPNTKFVLDSLKLNSNNIKQKVLFKAQLFVPYSKQKIIFETLNKDCVKGFYIKYSELLEFKNYKFHFPSKLNWLVDLHNNVDWQDYDFILSDVEVLINNNISPLCWIKSTSGKLNKIFIVWW